MRAITTTEDISNATYRVASRGMAVGWIALVGVAIVSVFAGEIPRWYQFVPLLVSIVFLGLPHGAVDHLLFPRVRGESLTPRWLALVSGIYLLFGGLYAVIWFLWPVAAVVCFLCLTWLHWGQGELYGLVEILGVDYLDSRTQQALTVLVRGGAPMVLPLVAFPDQYQLVVGWLVGLFDQAAAGALEPLFQFRVRAAVMGLYGLCLALTVGVGYSRTTDLDAWLLDTGEMLLLTAYFLLVPPILAIGVYFTFWHSLRHVTRTVLLHDPSTQSLANGDLLPAVRRFVRDAAPLTAGALVILGGFGLLVPRTPAGTEGLVALYLVCIAVLTLPHTVIVSWLDFDQGIL